MLGIRRLPRSVCRGPSAYECVHIPLQGPVCWCLWWGRTVDVHVGTDRCVWTEAREPQVALKRCTRRGCVGRGWRR